MLIAAKLWPPIAVIPVERLHTKPLVLLLGRFPASSWLHVIAATLLAALQLACLKLAQVKQKTKQNKTSCHGDQQQHISVPFQCVLPALEFISTQYSLLKMRWLNSLHLIPLIFVNNSLRPQTISIALICPFSSLTAQIHNLGTWILIHFPVFIKTNQMNTNPNS